MYLVRWCMLPLHAKLTRRGVALMCRHVATHSQRVVLDAWRRRTRRIARFREYLARRTARYCGWAFDALRRVYTQRRAFRRAAGAVLAAWRSFAAMRVERRRTNAMVGVCDVPLRCLSVVSRVLPSVSYSRRAPSPKHL
jgi:hypothetical protein